MNIVDQQQSIRHRESHTTPGELMLAMLLLGSMGAITWAIRGTSGWSGIDGTIVPGMTWGLLWWYICWRRGIGARGIPLWLGLGIALGGELGYGQYVSWTGGMFNAGDEILPVAPWIGYAWFLICGIAWGATGGIALGWALAGRKSLGVWLARLAIPVGVALCMRLAVRAWPRLFFPNWDLGLYEVDADSAFDPAGAANTQWTMIAAWLISALFCALAWIATTKVDQSSRTTRKISVGAVAAAIVLLLYVAQWLFFPEDQLGLFAGELGQHLGRTVYTNSQNAIVVGWWIGALVVAALGRDRVSLFAGLVLGIGFGIGFPVSALWCLGYAYAPNLIDWWKMWELNAGCFLGLLYTAVLYWAIRQRHVANFEQDGDGRSVFRLWCETLSMGCCVFLVIYVMAREEFFTVGILLGLFYVVSLCLIFPLASLSAEGVTDQRRRVSLVYSAFLLIFIMAWGASARTGILLGLYSESDVDQYAWPVARVVIFTPVGLLIVGGTMLVMWQVLCNPRDTLPQYTSTSRMGMRFVDLMTFTGVVGAASIWPAKIGVLYALFLALALFAFNRLNHHFDRADASTTQSG